MKELSKRLRLAGDTAAELMSPNPVSIRDNASVNEAIALFADKALDAVPVIDEAGTPIGVLSQSDILIHEREMHSTSIAVCAESALAGAPATGSQAPKTDLARARDIMTPALLSVTPETPASRVVKDLIMWKIKQLFVVDHTGGLIGTISAQDILRKLT